MPDLAFKSNVGRAGGGMTVLHPAAPRPLRAAPDCNIFPKQTVDESGAGMTSGQDATSSL